MTETKTAVAARASSGVPDTVEGFNELVGAVRLLDIRLTSLDAKLKGENLPDDQTDLSLTLGPPQFRASYDEGHSILACGVRFTLMETNDQEDNSEVLKLSAEYDLLYHVPNGVPIRDDSVNLF